MCISLCTTVIYNAAQSSSDNLPFYTPHSHHCSDVVHWRGEGAEALLTDCLSNMAEQNCENATTQKQRMLNSQPF